MTDQIVKSAVLYCRISDARDGETAGVERQEADARKLADRLGWSVGKVVVENDTSAFKRRKVTLPDGTRAMRVVRPGWREMLEDLAAGRADGLISYDLDRSCRDPRDLEDLIDVVEMSRPRVPVQSVTGSLQLATDSDVTTARIMTAVANKSSRDTARRVARARQERAQQGRMGGGKRPYGMDLDGTHREGEAAEIRQWADQVLAGVSLRQIVADLRKREVPTVLGGTWSTRVVKGILMAPRIAGIVVYRGEEIGPGSWEPVIPEETYRAVVRRLSDPSRGRQVGRTPRYLGTGIYKCGVEDCGGLMRVRSTTARHQGPTYRCGNSYHLVRSVKQIDRVVEKFVIERLSRSDAVDLLAGPVEPGVDTRALHAEAVHQRAKRDAYIEDEVADRISRAAMLTGVGAAERRLDEIKIELERAAVSNPVADLPVGTPQVKEAWEGLDLGRQRAVLRALFEVTVFRGAPGRQPDGSYFDPRTVKVTPKPS